MKARSKVQKAKEMKASPGAKGATLSLDAQHALILESRGIALSLAYKMLRHWGASLDQDDVTSAVDLALCTAAQRFDRNAGVAFLTFAYYSVKGELIKIIKTQVAQSNELIGNCAASVQIAEHALPEEGFELDRMADPADLSSPEHQCFLSELREQCNAAFEKLSDLEKKVIFLADYEEMKVARVARKLAYSRGHTSMVRHRALRKMRSELWMYDEAA